MAISVVMPALEMAQETGKLVSWLKKEGQSVSKGEPLLEIETDKAVMEIEATGDGVLAGIKAKEGDVIHRMDFGGGRKRSGGRRRCKRIGAGDDGIGKAIISADKPCGSRRNEICVSENFSESTTACARTRRRYFQAARHRPRRRDSRRRCPSRGQQCIYRSQNSDRIADLYRSLDGRAYNRKLEKRSTFFRDPRDRCDRASRC